MKFKKNGEVEEPNLASAILRAPVPEQLIIRNDVSMVESAGQAELIAHLAFPNKTNTVYSEVYANLFDDGSYSIDVHTNKPKFSLYFDRDQAIDLANYILTHAGLLKIVE
jgi:hypothetical protein